MFNHKKLNKMRKSSFSFRSWAPLRLLILGLCGALSLSLSACNDDDDDAPAAPSQNIVQVAQSNADFSTLVAAVVKADLATTLSGAGPFTVCAPTNAAFAKLAPPFNSAASISAITDAAQISQLRGILLYHVVGANIKAADIAAGASSATTARPASMVGGTSTNDNTLYLSKSSAGVFLNGSTQVTMPDISASNGTIHAINNVLMPPTQTIAQLVTTSASAATPEFTYLLQALQRPAAAAVLTAAADPSANVTVFAPTDAAFRALLGSTPLSAVSDADLLAILSLHVVGSGRVFSSDLTPGTVSTLGGNITVASAGGGYTLKGGSGAAANVAMANILTTNGVVHVIDQVIQP
jgi:uncharacterized surface protein with fasciclin (FAS1) repeats